MLACAAVETTGRPVPEHSPADLDSVALDLDHRDALPLVGDDDVHLAVALARDSDVGQHEPPVAQPVDERLHHGALLFIGERRHRQVLGDQDPHRVNCAVWHR